MFAESSLRSCFDEYREPPSKKESADKVFGNITIKFTPAVRDLVAQRYEESGGARFLKQETLAVGTPPSSQFFAFIPSDSPSSRNMSPSSQVLRLPPKICRLPSKCFAFLPKYVGFLPKCFAFLPKYVAFIPSASPSSQNMSASFQNVSLYPFILSTLSTRISCFVP